MNSRQIFNRLIILGFFALIGYSFAASFAVGSVMGIILSVISLGATLTFLYLLSRRPYEAENREPEQI